MPADGGVLSATAPQPQASEISGTRILQSVDRVRLMLDSVERELSVEADNIDRLLDGIVEELDRKNKQIEDAERQLERVSAELHYYRTLVSLSEEQAQAVLDTFAAQSRRQPYVNAGITFAIGLLTGVLSSLAAHGAMSAGGAMLGRRPPPAEAQQGNPDD